MKKKKSTMSFRGSIPRKSVIVLIFLAIFTLSFFFPHHINLFEGFNDSKLDENPVIASSNVIFENLTISNGDELYEDIHYDFNATIYDSSNISRQFASSVLQTKLIGDDSIFNDSATLIQPSKTGVPSFFNYENGTIRSSGDLNSIDGDYYEIDSANYSGMYKGTYNFRYDGIGTFPSGWTDYGSDASNYVEVLSQIGVHKKPISLEDDGSNTYPNAYVVYGSPTANQYYEYYYRCSNPNSGHYLYFFIMEDGGTGIAYFYVFNGKLKNRAGSIHTEIGNINADTWYHIKIYCGAVVNCWIDGVQGGGNMGYHAAPTVGFNKFQIYSQTGFSGDIHIDAFGFTSDSDYTLGDNLDQVPSELNITTSIPVDSSAFYNQLSYAHRTNVSQTIDLSIYNNDLNQWDLINSSSATTFSEKTYLLNSSYINVSNYVNLRFYGIRDDNTEFKLDIDMLKILSVNKTNINLSKSFGLKGNWKYRFKLCSYGLTYYSSYIYFEVVQAIPNVEMISESDYTTRWDYIFGDNTTTLFEADFVNSEYWDIDVSNRYLSENYSYNNPQISNPYFTFNRSFTDSALKIINSYDANQRNEELLKLRRGPSNWHLMNTTDNHFPPGVIKAFTIDDDFLNPSTVNVITSNPDVQGFEYYNNNFYLIDSDSCVVRKYTMNWVDTGTSYDFSGALTWAYDITRDPDGYWYIRGLPISTVYKFNPDWSYTGTSIDIDYGYAGNEHDIYFDLINAFATSYSLTEDALFRIYDNDWGDLDIDYSLTDLGISRPLAFDYYNGYFYIADCNTGSEMIYQISIENTTIAKNYQGRGMLYCQTDQTELLKLNSPDLNLQIIAGDKIEIIYKTNSPNRIDFNLMNSGTERYSFTLSPQGNSDFNKKSVILTLDEDFSIDQLQFSGIFNDMKYLMVYNVSVFRNNELYTFYLNPFGRKDIFLPFQYYDVYIYENGYFAELKNITSSLTYQTIIFEAIDSILCYISLYDSNNQYLEFFDFTFYATYSLANLTYENKRLTENTLDVDKGSVIQFDIYDSFNTLIISDDIYAEKFLEITLNVFSLKIKNQASEFINYSLQKGLVSKTGNLFSMEMMEFHVSSGNYNFSFTNQEDRSYHSYSISLVNNQIFYVNTTYRTVYFAPFLINGLGFNYETLKFYINNTRKDFGFNVLTTETVALKVLDVFNQTIFDQTIDITGINEYNILLNLYSLKIRNEAFKLINYSLSLSGGPKIANNIFSGEIIEYILKAGNYILNYTNAENSKKYTLIFTISSNQFITLNTTYYNVFFSIFNYDGLGLPSEWFRFYINNVRRETGLNTLKTDTVNLKVLDYFNQELFNQDVYMRGYTEYNIPIEVYEMRIFNNYSHSVILTIERNGLEIKTVVEAQFSVPYRFLPNVNYFIQYSYLNGTVLGNKTVSLDENPKLVPFGYYTAEISPTPIEPILSFSMNVMALIVFISVAFFIIVLLYARTKGKINKIEENKQNAHKMRATSFNKSII